MPNPVPRNRPACPSRFHPRTTLEPLEHLEPRLLLANLPAGFIDEFINTDYSFPTAMAVAPDGRVFIAQQSGEVRIIKNYSAQFNAFPSSHYDGYGLVDFTAGTQRRLQRRLELAASAERRSPAFAPSTQPQRRKEALRMRVTQEARSIADTVINRLNLKHNGSNLVGLFPGKGPSNTSVLIALS